MMRAWVYNVSFAVEAVTVGIRCIVIIAVEYRGCVYHLRHSAGSIVQYGLKRKLVLQVALSLYLNG